MEKLTLKERAFVEEYFRNEFNGKQAYLKAYDTDNENSAAVNAHNLLKLTRIQDAIEVEEGGYKQMARMKGLDKRKIIEELKEIILGEETVVSKGEQLKVRYDAKQRNAAIITLCKLMGDFTETRKTTLVSETQVKDIDLKNLTDEQLVKLRESLMADL